MTAKLDKPNQGKLLVSGPFSQDPFFKRSVILMVEHNTNGSLGFILNKPMGIMLNDVLPDFPKFNSQLFFGGPVNKESLYYIHRHGEEINGSIKIANGIYWGGDFDSLKKIIEEGKVTNKDLRFFMGYSGWGPEQLETELGNKGWLVTNGKINHSFSPKPKLLWRDVLRAMGSKYAVLANFADDPSLN